jgi:HK97 family phage portal protein
MKFPNIFGKKEKNVPLFEKLTKATSIRALEEEYTYQVDAGGNNKNLFDPENSFSNDILYTTVRNSPECMACINAIVEDIMSDGWRFEGSKSAVEKAEKFETMSNFWEILTDTLIDMLITGDGYILKLNWNDEKRKSFTQKIVEKVAGVSEKEIADLVDKEIPKDLQMVKSKTMQIKFNDTGVVTGYAQTANGKKKEWSPQEIIHIRRGAIGGQPYGFTPLESMLSDIATLIFAKEFAGKFFENDGMPDWLVNLPDSTPGDKTYNFVKKEMNEMKDRKQKHRSLIATGNMTITEINKWKKDMEFPNLIRHFTQLILMGWGVPPYRVNYVMDMKTSDQQTGKIETGYYKNISFTQKSIENALNKYLWAQFKVKMKFRRAYKIDEMREAQIIQLLSTTGALSMEEARERMGMEPEMKGEPLNAVGDDKAIDFESDKKRESGDKKVDEPKDTTDNKLKQLIKKSVNEAIEISWFDFKRVVEQKVGEDNFSRGKVFFKENYDTNQYILYFNDGQWTYTTRVDMTPEFRELYIPSAIRIK